MSMPRVQEIFSSAPEFCTACGSILPVRSGTALDNQCYVCQETVDIKESAEVSYVIHFNEPDVYSKERKERKEKEKGNSSEAEGPTVDRKCKNCGHPKMSYAAIQLRSADEGQTCFYTCLNPTCKFKESENS